MVVEAHIRLMRRDLLRWGVSGAGKQKSYQEADMEDDG